MFLLEKMLVHEGKILIKTLEIVFGKVLDAHAAGWEEEGTEAKGLLAFNDKAGQATLPGDEGGERWILC